MNLSDSKKKLALAGVLCGLVAACLAYFGNPANMAFCIACFIRDTAGALGFHQAEVVQYARPEIIGLVIGAFIISVATKEYRSTAGSSPMIRFILGILILATCSTLLKASEAGPGSLHAPIIMSLIGGLIFGALAQKSRMCFAGGIRDAILMKNFDLLTIIAGLFVVMLIFNLATGRFVLGFNTPGIIAHSNHLWNILGMYAVGFAAVLAGGCPLRQLILAGQGSSDSAVTVLGMFFAAALCHNFGLASSGTAMNAETGELVAGAVTPNGKVACIICIIACFIIAFTNKREQAK